MELFHGTRKRFKSFDLSFKGTGEAGKIDGFWFTDNFIGARNHALFQNRNHEPALVYRCSLESYAVIADHSKPLAQQPEVAARLYSGLPVSISLKESIDWHCFSEPVYQKRQGKILYVDNRGLSDDEQILIYKRCGIHGVYDWEGMFTDAYLHGTTTVIFDSSVLQIEEIIEVR